MKKMMRVLSLVALGLGLATGAFAGAKVEKFEVKDADGQKYSQEQLKGKTTMLVFMQAACGQCRTELTDLNAKLDEIKAKAEVVLVVVDVNSERAIEFFKSKGVTAKMVLDPDFKLGAAADVGATPSTVVVDKELNIVKSKTGYRAGDLDKLLGEI